MADDFPRILPAESAREAVGKLLGSGWPSGLVLSPEGHLVGAFGKREVLRALSQRTGGFFPEDELGFGLVRGEAFRSEALRDVWTVFWRSPAGKVASQDVPTVPESTPLEAVARLFAGEEEDIVAVLRGARAVGAGDARPGPRGLSGRARRVSRVGLSWPGGARQPPVASGPAFARGTRRRRSPRRRGRTSAAR